jgi:hypothetical protein
MKTVLIFFIFPALIRFKNVKITNKMQFSVCGVFYLQYSYQYVSAGVSAIFRVAFLIQEYSCN